jgi:purine catabolism regulator
MQNGATQLPDREGGRVPGCITINEALQFEALRRVRVCAGHDRLDNTITGVNIVEVPEVTRWLKGGELLFTAFYAARDSLDAQLRLIREVARKGVAALAIKPGQYIPCVCSEMVDEANSAGLPLLELPPDVPYMDVALPILRAIMDVGTMDYEVLNDFRHQFLRLIASKCDPVTLCAAISRFTSCPVGILDTNRVLIAWAAPESEGEWGDLGSLQSRVAKCVESAQGPSAQIPCEWHDPPLQLSVTPIDRSAETVGYMVLATRSGGRIGRIIPVILEEASYGLSLALNQNRMGSESKQQSQVLILQDLLLPDSESPGLTVQRARVLGVDLEQPCVVIAVRMAHDVGTRVQHEFISEMRSALETVRRSTADMILGRLDPHHMAGVANCPSPAAVEQFASRISQALAKMLSRHPPRTITVGLSRLVTGVAGFREGYTQASQSTELGQTVLRQNVISYAQLGAYLLLNELAGSAVLRDFCNRLIGELVEYDSTHGSDLCGTAQAFFACGRSLKRTAEMLHVHRNTLVYRLRRIEQIARTDFHDAEACFNLCLALKARRLIDPVRTG